MVACVSRGGNSAACYGLNGRLRFRGWAGLSSLLFAEKKDLECKKNDVFRFLFGWRCLGTMIALREVGRLNGILARGVSWGCK